MNVMKTKSSGDSCNTNPTNCSIAGRVSELEHDLADLRKQNNSTHERVFDRIGELEKVEGIQGEQFKHIVEKLGDINSALMDVKSDSKNLVSQVSPLMHKLNNIETLEKTVEDIKMKPAKKWDGVVEKVIMMVVTAVAAFVLAKVGLG